MISREAGDITSLRTAGDAGLLSDNPGGIPIRQIMQIYAKEAMKVFGDRLKAVILYGSYARGDFDSESDIDIMVLLDLPDEQMAEARKKMRRIADDLDLKYDCVISSIFQSYDSFENYKSASPFYQNVERDGVLVG
ncbi:MAG: nucleotidyltransferase domain-containing protein [Lachnospiraceae bacterium]|nr:nucleotidyltransferase domain-containing protein [Lachnospiraceae bacterium]MCD7841492.1 nucleotidyltransferase domain-containing protein [Lachnospiraceae bacterium]